MLKTGSSWASTTTFVPGVAERLGFYVYLLIDPSDNTLFYVGKGSGNRCFAHVAEALKTRADSVGDYPKLARIRAIEAAGNGVRINLLRHGLSEPEAYLVESAAIDLLDLLDLPGLNQVGGHDATELGHMSVADINARYGSAPVVIDPEHRVALIRITRQFVPNMPDDALYEGTRKWWKIGPRRRRLGTPAAPEWAMTVFGGVIRAVYRIEGWEQPTQEDIAADAKRVSRWAFRGMRDPNMEAIYLYGDVSAYLGVTQNPVRYVNCW